MTTVTTKPIKQTKQVQQTKLVKITSKPAKKPVNTFRDLRTWQAAYDLALAVYRQAELFPKREQHTLVSQMTNAAVTVCSSVAEAFGHRLLKDKERFFAAAHTKLNELENYLLVAEGLGYLNSAQHDDLRRRGTTTYWALVGLQHSNAQWDEKHALSI